MDVHWGTNSVTVMDSAGKVVMDSVYEAKAATIRGAERRSQRVGLRNRLR